MKTNTETAHPFDEKCRYCGKLVPPFDGYRYPMEYHCDGEFWAVQNAVAATDAERRAEALAEARAAAAPGAVE